MPKNRQRIVAAFSIGFLFLNMVLGMFSVRAAESEHLAFGKVYTVSYDSPVDNAFPGFSQFPDLGKLTDGKKSDRALASRPEWVRFYKGGSLTITIDLGGVAAVDSVSVGQLQLRAAGILASRWSEVWVSEGGENFALVATVKDAARTVGSAPSRLEQVLDFDKAVLARYVRVVLSSDNHTYIDEIEVFGTTDTSEAVKAETNSGKPEIGRIPQSFDGLSSLAAVYAGKYWKGQSHETGVLTERQLLPLVAKLDAEGKPVGKFFDGLVILPLDPLAGGDGGESYSFSKMTGLQAYIDSLFPAEGVTGLRALERAVGSLGTDEQFPVYITLPYVENSERVVFGELDGELFLPDNLANRTRINAWFMDAVIEAFSKAGYQNLRLGGFFWGNPLVRYDMNGYEEQLVQEFCRFVQEKDLKAGWITEYCAPGFADWQELGFDAAILRAGYAGAWLSHDEPNAKSVDDTFLQAKRYGLGFALEADAHADDHLILTKKSYQYLHTAHKNEISGGKGLTLFLQTPGQSMFQTLLQADATDLLYNEMYAFVTGQFTVKKPVVAEGQFYIVESNGEWNKIVPRAEHPRLLPFMKLEVVLSEQGNGLQTQVDGETFMLSAQTNGLYDVTVAVSDGYNLSDEVVVKVLVADQSFVFEKGSTPIGEDKLVLYESSYTGERGGSYELLVGSDGRVRSAGKKVGPAAEGEYILSASGSLAEKIATLAVKKTLVYRDDVSGRIAFADTSVRSGINLWVIIGVVVLVSVTAAVVYKFYARNKGAKHQ